MAGPRGARRREDDAAHRRAAEAASDPAERAREIALRLLTHAPRSASQLRDGLLARDVDPGTAELVVDRYIEVGLLDDSALAATIVRTRHAERGQAGRAIRQELRRKGFDDHDIETALAQVDEDDERRRASELAARRWHQLASHPDEVRTRRVVAMLGRKGYSSSLAFALVRDLRDADSQEDH
ncbi:regulatory protein RecX [Demequina sp. SYSU T00039]|uniref:Regulatory protein RecX n=1 Tax=Demequina lignilytica TaxID=3051663 RepID=A0AAW7LZY1_9MICO|nr:MULTISPECIES: regulatory protein RecX [unclassified Demequina]MDN4477145.1 regulatory protein RecX [Demequina sp. SYSU T00039-1]MDN4487318.1 regulatory protein RecX [Demequina sp. SYSU T00039]MDN4491071.1 regulatory protein RecX [Demequina sp. SYSU T00068]